MVAKYDFMIFSVKFHVYMNTNIHKQKYYVILLKIGAKKRAQNC